MSKFKLYNYKYTVDKITKDNFTLFNKIDKEYFIVPRKMIYESFTLPFCSTIESIQGKTINDDITIFDLDSNYMSKNKCIIHALGFAYISYINHNMLLY